MRKILLVALFAILALPLVAAAQTHDPALPDTLQNLAAKGAQIRYLGREKNLDGWVAIHQGQEQYFYATPDREALIMGLLFDKAGKLVTIRQVQNLQKGNEPTLESLATTEAPDVDAIAEIQKQLKEQTNLSPSQKLFTAIENSNWLAFGDEKAPVVYAFLDPQCPHCHAFMKDIRKTYLDAGQIQLRMIPVGFHEDTKAQAAFLLAAPDYKERWYKHLDGDEKALPIDKNVNKQAVEANLALMAEWKFDATPMIVYKSAKGDIKIVRGRPKNPTEILTDLY